MDSSTITKLLNDADEKLFWAEDEFNRPTEDVVAMCVCLNVKDVMSNYLKAFTVFNHVNLISPYSLNDLLKECIRMDANFQKIDLSIFMCKNEIIENNSRYCMTHEKTKECLEVA